MSDSNREREAISQLCPACGLCCNGVLFGDVELREGDDPKHLAALKFRKKGRKQAFPQPCACFDGRLCQIYATRPVRCRTFECKALKLVQAGDLTTSAALHQIKAAKRQAALVRDLMGKLGNHDEHVALGRRYAKLMAEPMDLADHDNAERRATLMLEVDRLMKMLHAHFLD